MNEHKEHLEQNIVAENLGGVLKKVEPYSKLILAGVVAVILGLLAVGLYTSGQTAKRSDATFQLLMNDEDVATKYPDTAAAAWSKLFEADENLALGINSLYEDREEAESLLGQAKEQFAKAAKASDNTVLRSRANYGLAVASESLGQIDEAKTAYEQTIAINESEQMVEVAKERLERLEKPSTAEFLAWFAEQDFAPADPSLPPELPGAGSLPDLPDLDLPALDLPALDLPALDLGDDLRASDAEMKSPEDSGIAVPDAKATETAGDETKDDAPTPESEMKVPAEEAEAPAAETDAGEASAAETDAETDAADAKAKTGDEEEEPQTGFEKEETVEEVPGEPAGDN